MPPKERGPAMSDGLQVRSSTQESPIALDDLPTHEDRYVYAGNGHWDIGWQTPKRGGPREFIISQYGKLGFGRKVRYRFPVSEAGWTQTWKVLSTECPDLAATLVAQVESALRRQRGVTVVEEDGVHRQALNEAEALHLLPSLVILGGSGYGSEVSPGDAVDVYFTRKGLCVTQPGSASPRFDRPYNDMRDIEFSGPGRVTKGGGFFGGGFGLTAAAEGMIVASVLNSLTTRTKIQTSVRVAGVDFELFLFCSSHTPEDLRILLSEELRRLNKGEGSEVPVGRPVADVAGQLSQLADLLSKGLLTAEEFAAAKALLLHQADAGGEEA